MTTPATRSASITSRENFGVAVPDVTFAFSSSEAYAALTELGEAGRRSYIGFRVADLIFLSIYAVALSGLIVRLFGVRRLVLKFVGFGLTVLVVGGGLVYRAARFLRERRSEHVSGWGTASPPSHCSWASSW